MYTKWKYIFPFIPFISGLAYSVYALTKVDVNTFMSCMPCKVRWEGVPVRMQIKCTLPSSITDLEVIGKMRAGYHPTAFINPTKSDLWFDYLKERSILKVFGLGLSLAFPLVRKHAVCAQESNVW